MHSSFLSPVSTVPVPSIHPLRSPGRPAGIAAAAWLFGALALGGCVAAPPVVQTPSTLGATCDATQIEFQRAGDQQASPYGIAEHLNKHFTDHKVSWLMKDSAYQTYVVQKQAPYFGRCTDGACYLFAAPSAVIHKAVQDSLLNGQHDAERLGKSLGLPGKNFEGPLRLFTLNLATGGACVRLPLERDPGVWKCQTAADTDCFKFGGFTSGGIPEVMVINASVAAAQSEEVR